MRCSNLIVYSLVLIVLLQPLDVVARSFGNPLMIDVKSDSHQRSLTLSAVNDTGRLVFEETLLSPIKRWAGSMIGLRFGGLIYSLAMGAGPMLSASMGRVPMDHRGCLYFSRALSEPTIIRTSYEGWRVYGIRYEATAGADPTCERINPELRSLIIEKSLLVAVKDNIAIVLLKYRNIGDRKIIFEQYPTHIHDGTDGIGVVSVYPATAKDVITNGLYVDDPNVKISPSIVNEIRGLHDRTELVINRSYKGELGSLGRWQTLHYQSPGGIHIQHIVRTDAGSVKINLYALNDVIQVLTNNLILVDTYVNNGILDIQHKIETLNPGDSKPYYYVVSIESELSKDDMDKLMNYITEIDTRVSLHQSTTETVFELGVVIEWLVLGYASDKSENSGNAVCAHGDYIYVVGGETDQYRIEKRKRSNGELVKAWRYDPSQKEVGEVLTDCIVVGDYLFVVGKRWLGPWYYDYTWSILKLDLDLNLIKKEELNFWIGNEAPHHVTTDGHYIYVVGSDEIDWVDWAIRIEKRSLVDLSPVKVIRLNPTKCSWCVDAAFGAAINPVTSHIWVVGVQGGDEGQGFLLIMDKDLNIVRSVLEKSELLSITFDENGNAYIGGKNYVLLYNKDGDKLKEVEYNGTVYKTIYLGGYVLAIATNPGEQHEIAVYTSKLELVSKKVISTSLGARFILDTGKASVNNNNIYLAGTVKYPNGTTQWIIYSLKIVSSSDYSREIVALKQYINRLVDLYELEISEFWRVFYSGLKASRIGTELSENITEYVKGNIGEYVIKKVIEKAIGSLPDLHIYYLKRMGESPELIELVEKTYDAVGTAMLVKDIISLIKEYYLDKHLADRVLRKLTDDYVSRLVIMHSAYMPLNQCLSEVIINDGKVSLQYSETCIDEWIVDYLSRLDNEKRDILLEYLDFLTAWLTVDIVDYPVSDTPPIGWFHKITRDIETGIDILGFMEITYTLSHFLATKKGGLWFDWASLSWEAPNEYTKDELKKFSIYATVGISWMALERRMIWYRGVLVTFLLEHLFSTASESELRAELNRWRDVERLVLSLRELNMTSLYRSHVGELSQLWRCYLGSNTYKNSFLSYGFYVAPLSSLEALVNQLGTFEKHEVLLVCYPLVRSRIVFNPDIKPNVEVKNARLNLSLEGIVIYVDLAVFNPYDFPFKITSATYPSILEIDLLVPIREIVKKSDVYFVPPRGTLNISVRLLTCPWIGLVPYSTDLFVNNAHYARINLFRLIRGWLIVFHEDQNKLYMTVLTEDGSVVGYKDNMIKIEISDAQFVDLNNGIQIAYLPVSIRSFKIIVNAKDAHFPVESYNISIISLDQQVETNAVIKANITKGEIHQFKIRIDEDKNLIIKPVNVPEDRVIIEGSAIVVESQEGREEILTGHDPKAVYLWSTLLIIMITIPVTICVLLLSRRRKRG